MAHWFEQGGARRCVRGALVLGTALGLSGCAVVGPRSITAGRGAYTEVINRTEDEQVLNVIVRQRYDETFGMLSVASVTASLKFRAQTGANVGIGPSGDYEGNLVPFSAGVAYEESPTISYVPLSGEEFSRRMLSPVSVREWNLLAQPVKHPGRVLALSIRRINGLRNPLPGEAMPSPGFDRFVELYDRLRGAGVLNTVRSEEGAAGNRDYWDLHDYEDAHVDEVREFLGLLGIDVEVGGAAIILPVRSAVGRSSSAIHVQARSAHDVLEAFATGIEVPAAHLEAGLAAPLRIPVPEVARFITIRSSEARPENATVAIFFRDHWFYIDGSDTESKRAFAFLRLFIGMRLAQGGDGQQAPVLTVPVK